MQIQEFEIEGLLGRNTIIRHDLHNDLAILTGRNGAGKTSVLKLLWAVISGNILIALDEVPFRTLRVRTDLYECSVYKLGRRTCKVELVVNGESRLFEDVEDDDGDVVINAEDSANEVLRELGTSVFFPTFRRIEGGFSVSPSTLSMLPSGARFTTNALSRSARARVDIEEALSSLSRVLTHERHVFVSAISTVDIGGLLLRKFAELSEEANRFQTTTHQEVVEAISKLDWKGEQAQKLTEATKVLDEVRQTIQEIDARRRTIMAPMEEVSNLVERLFDHVGIKFGPMKFGDAAHAVNSDALSAGEKQMLSFVCYNAFYRDSIIFIDEPELSLHSDWQRQLFPILARQQSSNQFVITTHSPFIYSKYPEKELELATDRGDNDDK